MGIITTRRSQPADTIIQTVLDDTNGYGSERQARAIIMRLNRTYSHAIIDGTDFILVPATPTPPSVSMVA